MNHIKKHWESRAEEYKTDASASWGDTLAMDLEISNIIPLINENDSVLDVGCGNAYSTFKIFQSSKNITMTGLDFSKNMIANANKRKNELDFDNITFKNGEMEYLPFKDETFDVVYTIRTLINLPTWERQRNGINECIRVAKPKGTIIFSESFWEPFVLLNSIRLLFGLKPLVEHDFNKYLKMERLESYLNDNGFDFEILDFSSIYYLGSRIVREIVSQKYDGYINPINSDFYNLEKKYSGGKLGIQQAVIIKKE